MKRAALLLGVALFLFITSVAPADATALPVGDCTTSKNVILAVDFSHWGGPVLRSCDTANGTTDTGFALLHEGGWSAVGDQHDGPAFICRIGYSGYQGGTMYPTAAQDACVVTPPASAYWSYWHANPGQNTWSYSPKGARGYVPEPGSVDLWSFGATNLTGTQGAPTISPNAVRARNTVPIHPTVPAKPKPPVALTHAAAPPAPGTTPVRHGGPIGTTKPGATTTTSSSVTSSGAAATSGPPTTTTSTRPPILDARPRAEIKHSTGSASPVILGGALVLVLAAGSGTVIWRRRRQG